jgi:hypothetical protein
MSLAGIGQVVANSTTPSFSVRVERLSVGAGGGEYPSAQQERE